ncbi:hypothetical protein [Amycolatopsis sp. 195334CR]|uniref:hypothetical protein n=1 Tax=Amycolatopsis sp. 195334CR TaxID=2814588 RepID=UPI001A906FD2|nr:hypothetical protein [Amycolatopsis sp. 195334CR]MBN6040030.1 hypothetical protein [Amycolatopsis sp. 195334CR]
MNNRENRARRAEVNDVQTPTPWPSTPELPPAALPWSSVLGCWGSDGHFRRDVLIALTLVLTAVVVIVGMVTGALGPLVRNAAGSGAVRIVVGSVLGLSGLACGGLRLHRRRTRRANRGERHAAIQQLDADLNETSDR